MRHAFLATGWVLVLIGGGLVALGIWAWPPGGLLFALPYIFLIPGVPIAGAGAVLLWLGYCLARAKPDTPDNGA